MRAFRRGRLAWGLAALAVVAGCSSQSSSGSANEIECKPTPLDESGLVCGCYPATASDPANSTACSVASLGVDAVCSLHAGSSCQCDPFVCVQSAPSNPEVLCTYARVNGSNGALVSPAACVGSHFCMDTTSLQCSCQTYACSTDQTEVPSCTDAAARAQMGTAFETFNSGIAVQDCRAGLAGSSGGSSGSSGGSSGSGSSSGGAMNICPGGPGKCSNGDSSTCNCGTSCVQVTTCVGCPYSCVKGCANDADCAGFYSGGANPVPLVCVPASAMEPTPHCGI